MCRFFTRLPQATPPPPESGRVHFQTPGRAIIKHLSADGQSGLGFIVHLGSEDTAVAFYGDASRSFLFPLLLSAATDGPARRRNAEGFSSKLESFCFTPNGFAVCALMRLSDLGACSVSDKSSTFRGSINKWQGFTNALPALRSSSSLKCRFFNPHRAQVNFYSFP